MFHKPTADNHKNSNVWKRKKRKSPTKYIHTQFYKLNTTGHKRKQGNTKFFTKSNTNYHGPREAEQT